MSQVDKALKEIIVKGVTKAKEIVKDIEERLISMATHFKCEDALPESVSHYHYVR